MRGRLVVNIAGGGRGFPDRDQSSGPRNAVDIGSLKRELSSETAVGKGGSPGPRVGWIRRGPYTVAGCAGCGVEGALKSATRDQRG